MGARVMVVEDEAIISMDLQNRLRKLGYEVAGAVVRGEDVLPRALESHPDLVLMDIMLGGEMDGIESAAQVREELDLPVVFVTAHSDEATLRRAKISEPYGYVLKPFEDREIKTSVEIALYRHQADRKLRGMERWLATTLKSIGDGVIATDLNGAITFMNAEAERLTGWPTLDAIGRPFTEVFNALNARTGQPIEDPVAHVLREGVLVNLPADTALIARDGRRVDVDDCAAPMRDLSGKVSGVVLVFRDATRQREMGDRLRQTEEMLQHAQRLEDVGRLTGGVVHDFNNLMTIVLGYSSMLLKRFPQGDSNHKFVESIQSAAQRAAGLTRQLLAFSRRHAVSPQILDVNEHIQKMRDALSRLIGEVIEIEVLLAPQPCKISIDPVQLDQILINLAANARDAMPEGGKLSIETERIQEREGMPCVRLSIHDTGMGMDEPTKARIFEPFFTTKELGKGTGLGLATVQSIVMHYEGRIELETAPTKGCCFRISLPLAESPAAPVKVGEAEPVKGGRETILVVEDDAYVRSLVCEILAELGYKTLDAQAARPALEILRRNVEAISLVVSDLVMPGMGSKEMLEQLRQIKPNLPVLFMSGYSDRDTLRHDPHTKATGFLAKPFSPAALADCVRMSLDTSGKA